MKILSARPLGSFAIQSLGAAGTFAIGIAIAVFQGPDAQGRFGLVRAGADLIVAFALFGLPQGMVHAINQGGTSPAVLERAGLRYALSLSVLAAVAASAAAIGAVPHIFSPWRDNASALFALLIGSVGWTLQGWLRVFSLCRASAMQFAWASVLPSLTLLVGVAVLIAIGSTRYELAVAGSGLASAAINALALAPQRRDPRWREGAAVNATRLFADSGHAFVQTGTLAAQAWVTLKLMQWCGATDISLGLFVFAAYVYQAFSLPASFASPLLFARISATHTADRRYPAARLVSRVVSLSVAAGVVCAVLLPLAVVPLFGARYQGAIPAGVVLALAGPLVVVNRLGVAVLFGQGRFRAATLHALVRALAVPGLAWFIWNVAGVGLVLGAATAWLFAEAIGACVLGALWRIAKRSSRADGGTAITTDGS